MSESLNHSLNQFIIKKSFLHETSDHCYERAIDCFNSIDLFKNTDSLRKKIPLLCAALRCNVQKELSQK